MSLRSNAEAVKRLLADGSGLFHLIHQFNINPAAYAHLTWLEALMPPDLLFMIKKTRRGISRLSKILLQQQNLSHDAYYDFDCRWWRFALLPTDVLLKLTLYCGLAALHRQIATMVDKSALVHIKKNLGEPDYVFAVKRAPLLIGQQHGIDLCLSNDCDVAGLARQYGTAYFMSHFSDAPRAITARLAFKFTRLRKEVALQRAPEADGWQLFKRILIHEIEPRWRALFS